MKGILLKDLLCIRKNIWVCVFIIAVFGLFSDNAVVFALFYSIMLPVNAIAYDERSRFERLLPALPVSSLTYVLSKYLIAYGFIALTAVLSIALSTVKMHAFAVPEELPASMALCLLATAITLVLIFRFGVEKGRMIYMVSVVVQAGLLGALGAIMEEQTLIPLPVIGWIAFALAAAVNVGSVFAARNVYENRLLA